MPKFCIISGLPGSGKTTAALEMKDYVRVNRDDIRRKLETEGWSWSRENEKHVVNLRNIAILANPKEGKNVVSDDTNLSPRVKKELQDLALSCGDVSIEEKFINLPVEECIIRDSKRTGKARVGEGVIRGMAKQFGLEDKMVIEKAPPFDLDLSPIIICDLDGTAALHNGRSPYDEERCGEDLPNEVVKDILNTYNYSDQNYVPVVYCSGRQEKVRKQTLDWLDKHTFPAGLLYMRPTGDTRKDQDIKLEIYNNHIRGKYNVLFVLDDRDRVVKRWRELGLTCLQVAEGAF